MLSPSVGSRRVYMLDFSGPEKRIGAAVSSHYTSLGRLSKSASFTLIRPPA